MLPLDAPAPAADHICWACCWACPRAAACEALVVATGVSQEGPAAAAAPPAAEEEAAIALCLLAAAATAALRPGTERDTLQTPRSHIFTH